jgi:hypothetical protein
MYHSAGFVSTLHMCHCAGFGSILYEIVQDLAPCCGPQRMMWFHPMDHSAGSASMLWGTARDLVPALCHSWVLYHAIPQHEIWFHAMVHSADSGSTLYGTAWVWFDAMGHRGVACSTLWPQLVNWFHAQWAIALDRVPRYGHMLRAALSNCEGKSEICSMKLTLKMELVTSKLTKTLHFFNNIWSNLCWSNTFHKTATFIFVSYIFRWVLRDTLVILAIWARFVKVHKLFLY